MRTQELTNEEQAHFRRMVRECEERPGWTIARITRELGYTGTGPLYTYLKPDGGGPSRSRYDTMVLLHGKVCGTGRGRGLDANGSNTIAADTIAVDTIEGLELLADHLMNNARIAAALQKRPMTVAKLDAVLANLHTHLRADAELLMGLVQ